MLVEQIYSSNLGSNYSFHFCDYFFLYEKKKEEQNS